MTAVEIDRDAAREAADRELAKPLYPRPSPKQHLIDAIETLLRKVAIGAAELPGGWFTISLLLIGLVVALMAALRVARRTLRTHRGEHPLFGPTELSAADHRAAAETAAAAADWAEAIRHRLRAVARELEQTGVLYPAPGRTANELARDAGAAVPSLGAEFTRAAGSFNDVSYGELPGTATDYQAIADLDDRLRFTAPLAGRR